MKKVLICFISAFFISSSVYPGESKNIVVVKSRKSAPYNLALSGFKKYLKKEQVDVHIIEYKLKGKEDVSEINKIVKKNNPALFFSIGTPATRIIQGKEFNNIPVVFAMILDPEKNKINPPGVSMHIPLKMKLKEIKRFFPDVKKIGLICSSSADFKEASRLAVEFGLEAIGKKINSKKEFPQALKNLSGRIDCFLMFPDSNVYFPESVEYLLVESLRKGFPVVGLSSIYTKAGALISLECDYEDLGAQAGEIALEILSGNVPKAEFVNPRKTNYSLNLIVAKRLGVDFSSTAIAEAKRIFRN